ncbi:chemotaxis protein CheA [Altererythrobacter aurantiacus]|uniref:Chemotaxis protein CheA n=1 Tax=Parapontixanthobacter aurantiacus TaxID=1463599 RepID=A0A844Z7B6_9SPHN|nr:chemotaxis protein CheA [Parapontixanthobacter aurantiacus]MXO84521.1 chemotaxis protein CheA [Parapontixanthobacter aurantiacus]
MDDLLADFVAETREMLESIEGEIIAWEADPGDRERLDSIFRFVHTVKGNCGFFDFPRLAKLSHAAEGALGEVRSGRRAANARLVTAVLSVIDRIAAMVDAIEAKEEFPEGGDEMLVSALEDSEGAVLDVAASHPREEVQTARASQSSAAPRSIRLPVELLDRVMSGVSDMVLARNDLARRLRETPDAGALDGPFERLSGILSEVREGISQMRMHHIDHLYQSLPRLVRDLSNELGKQVMIDFEGGDVELDREIMEMIRDPMTHLLRNAIDHGIETPSRRIAAGKREIGLLNVSARHSGNEIRLTVTDDGKGLDPAKIVAKAIETGVVTEQEASRLSNEEKINLIFAPGLSTAEEVSEISGRGVGMDVVRANLERIGGSIKVTSKPGEFTSFQLQIPLTLSIVAGLTVQAGGHQFAIPQSYVLEIVRRRSSSVETTTLGANRLVKIRGNRIPYLALHDVLALPKNAGKDEGEASDLADILILVHVSTGDRFALGVDSIFDYEDLVVKPLAPAIMATGFYSGSTLLDNGTPILMLDMREIAAKHNLVSATRASKSPSLEADAKKIVKKAAEVMTFETFDGLECAVRMPMVLRIDTIDPATIDYHGKVAQTIIDDRLMPLVGIGPQHETEETVRTLRLSDGTSSLLYAVARISDTQPLTSEIVPSDDPAYEGTVLLNGRPVRLIDGHQLFAKFARPDEASNGLSCALPDDEWSKAILEPLVVAAGYRVERNVENCDVAIVMGDAPPAQTEQAAGRVIRLRETEIARESEQGTVYRYDRDALVAALSQATGGNAA